MSPDDTEIQQILDVYLRELQDGRKPDRDQIAAGRPGLGSLLECLERLEALAPAPAAPSAEPPPTLPPRENAAANQQRGSGLSGPAAEFGKQVGKYQIERELGRGGMGVVYLARDTELGRSVALKMILSGSLADPEQRQRFQNEVRSAARLDHEGIVRIFDTGEFNGLTYLAMQFVDGPSLADVLRTQRLDRDMVLRCVIQLARTVAYLHSQGIVHRDLKPGNVLLAPGAAPAGSSKPDGPARSLQNATPKITDFGLAKLLDDSSGLTCSNVVMGTPAYMAPEQARGESARVGPEADIYALGVILYELLTGRPPFTGATALEVLLQVMSNEPAPPRRFDAGIPRDLEYICLKCLEKAREQRYQSAQQLADALQAHLKGDDTHSPGQTIWNLLRRWALRVPGLAARVGILALVAITLIVRALHSGRYSFSPTYPGFHLWHLLAILSVWIILSALFQRGLRSDWGNRFVPYLWSSTEMFILTALLVVTDSLASPLDVGFPLLILGASLWLRERLVWFTVACAVLGYSTATALHFYASDGQQFHRHVIFVVGLLVTGYLLSFQVRRFRMLSRFYEGRALD